MNSKIAVFVVIVVFAPLAALAQSRDSFVQGFGGLRLSTALATDTTFGGSFGGSLTPNIQAVGEVGRISNVLPATLDSFLTLTPIDVHVSAWYGEGGVRFLTSPLSAVRAYTEATAGLTRLRTGYGGIGGPTARAIVNTALQFLDRTDPLATLGVGVILQRGPVVADLGYRYTRIFASDTIAGVLAAGDVNVQSVRVGIGVRF